MLRQMGLLFVMLLREMERMTLTGIGKAPFLYQFLPTSAVEGCRSEGRGYLSLTMMEGDRSYPPRSTADASAVVLNNR